MHPLAARVACRVVLCGALASVVGCDKNVVSPSPQTTYPSIITIAGTTTLNQPGDTSQLKVTLTSPDGTTSDVTSVAVWSGSEGLVTVRGGLLTAVGYGRGSIVVTAEGLTGSTGVSVLPPGMYLVQGRVIAAGGPVAQARVEITSPSGTLSGLTNGSGAFTLPGAGPVTVRAETAGYQETVQQLTVEHDTMFVEIVLLRDGETPGTIRGSYVLTFTASPSCALLPEAMQRTYAATIEEGRLINQPENLIVTLSGSDFMGWGSDPGFTGSLQGTTVRFDITDDIDARYNLIEHFGNNFLFFSGTATGTVSDKTIATTFSGKVVLRGLPAYTDIAECTASDHRLALVR
jgi:hypothetical protein